MMGMALLRPANKPDRETPYQRAARLAESGLVVCVDDILREAFTDTPAQS